MGEFAPDVGEIVVYHSPNGPRFGRVTKVTMWDLVDIQLYDGTELNGIRRVVVILNDRDPSPDPKAGRFERLETTIIDQ